jgi:hypothetical protein
MLGWPRMEGANLRRKGILAVVLIAMLTLGVGAALAARSYSTKIVFLGNNSAGADQTFYGKLKTNSNCLAAREMGLFKKTSHGYKLLDVDLSSFNGAWAMRAELNGTPDLAIKVKKVVRNHGNVICKRDTLTLTPAPPV